MIEAAAATESYPIAMRGMEVSDEGMIYDAWLRGVRGSIWLRSFREVSTKQRGKSKQVPDIYGPGIPETIFGLEQRIRIKRLLERSGAIIACAADDPGHTYGYVCGELVSGAVVVHYAYVKNIYRKFGICRALLKALGFRDKMPLFYTHPTWATSKVGEEHFGAIFNPWRAD